MNWIDVLEVSYTFNISTFFFKDTQAYLERRLLCNLR
jgi:hypothetical protein